MKYKYLVVSGALNPDGSPTKRPVVEIEVSNRNQRRKFLAIIDSGADQIHMPAAIAEVLGIDREKCRTWNSMGISMQNTPGFIGELTFQVRNQATKFTAPVVFLDTDIPILLGRDGFFDKHRIRFEQDHDTFEIIPAPER
jgi:hypothetical protein